MKKKVALFTLVLSIFLMGSVNAQFGINNSIKNKYKNEAQKKGEEPAIRASIITSSIAQLKFLKPSNNFNSQGLFESKAVFAPSQ